MNQQVFNNIFSYSKKLFPICRSITGPGLLKTLRILKKINKDIKIHKIKSGTKVFDWIVPSEWVIKDAFVEDKFGKKIINFKKNNLHLINYSKPFSSTLTLKNLLKKIYSLPDKPNSIPYITSYYKKNWGFCTTHDHKKKIANSYNEKDKFKVKILSKFKDNGYMHYADLLIKGKSNKEILISTYCCHPSMANNEISGPLLSSLLIKHYSKKKNNLSIRFLFVPETIGAIAYLNKNLRILKKNFLAGYNLSCVGDNRTYSYIPTKYGNSISDIVILKIFKKLKLKYKNYSFLDRGSDERQFNSPNIDLPVVTFCRSKFGDYPEYHTSQDNLNLINKKGIRGSLNIMTRTIDTIMSEKRPMASKACEPFLTKYNLISTISSKTFKISKKVLDFIQYSDGKTTLDEIKKAIKVNSKELKNLESILIKKGLIHY